MRRSRVKRGAIYIGAIAVVLFTLMPYVLTIFTSLQREVDLTSRPPFPFKSVTFTLDSYTYILSYEPFATGFLHSAAVAVMTTAFVLLAGSLGAYAIARIRFPGRNFLFNLIVIVYMLPALAMLIPIVVSLKILGILDTFIGMMFAHSIILLPLMTWFLTGIFESVPGDIDEACRIDGYSRLKSLFKMVIPLTKLGFLMILVFSFINSWNDLMFANTVGIVKIKLLQPRILEFMSGARVLYTQMAAAGILSSLPVVALSIILQKQIVKGIMRGAVK